MQCIILWHRVTYLGLDMQVHDELVQRILPSMALMTPEPYCVAELWSLLELLPYRRRFEVYDAAQVSKLQFCGPCSSCTNHWQSVPCHFCFVLDVHKRVLLEHGRIPVCWPLICYTVNKNACCLKLQSSHADCWAELCA